jgi:hypothetical protein
LEYEVFPPNRGGLTMELSTDSYCTEFTMEIDDGQTRDKSTCEINGGKKCGTK